MTAEITNIPFDDKLPASIEGTEIGTQTILVRLADYRPVSPGIAGLYLNAWVQIWRGVAMMMAIPLALFIRGQR